VSAASSASPRRTIDNRSHLHNDGVDPGGLGSVSDTDRSAVALTVRGNRVEIVIDAGDQVRSYDLVATRNGHRVEINTGRGIVSDRSDPQSLAGALRMRPCR
jgi:hypothetical protein